MRKLLVLTAFFYALTMQSQELICDIVVDSQLTGNENVQVFRTLETQLKEFVNNTKWTNKNFQPNERINASMVIRVENYDNDVFRASIQIRSSRPIFNSSYNSPIYNFNDRDFSFRYQEFQNFIYNPTQFESNLISVLAYHVYIILAMDADSFALNGGESYYEQARTILNYSQQSNFRGWKPEDGLQSRFSLIDDIMSPTYKEFRNVLYNYHIKGLDIMSQNPKKGKEYLARTIKQFEAMNNRRPNSFLLRVFFDSKADEIEDIFSDGPSVNISDLVSSLNKIAPTYSNKWRNITF